MWIAEFEDGSLVAQFDPQKGVENKADPDWLPSRQPAPVVHGEEAVGMATAEIKSYDPTSPIGQLKEKGVQVKRVGWHNFSPKMAACLQANGHPVRSTHPPLSVVLNVGEGEEPVLARRMAKKYALAGATRLQMYDRGTGPTVYVIGIKDKAYIFIGEDGSIEMSSDFKFK